jgi:hypothetical protein
MVKTIKNTKSLSKKRFEALLKKAAQPVIPDSKGIETAVVHPCDGYNDKYKNQDKTEDVKD